MKISIQYRDDDDSDEWSEPLEVDLGMYLEDSERELLAVEDSAQEWVEKRHNDCAAEWPEPNETTKIEALVDGKRTYILDVLLEYTPSFSISGVKRKP